MKNLLIVESPAKAKTINKYLGNDYKVLASMGHVRSLVPKDGSVDVEHDFTMKFETLAKSSKAIKELVDGARDVDKIMLAPDPDREGEAIAWHVLEVLKSKKAIKQNVKIERITFNEITKESVNKAIKEPREIDMNLVKAQQARQALDYLVGFTLSPVLWRKLPGSKSAGRVQSVALRLICDREDEIDKFRKNEYWGIDVNFTNKLTASLTHIDGKKLDKLAINNEKQAKEIENSLRNKDFIVKDIEKKQQKRNPYPPFITSTLQQEASRKLGFSSKQTMSVAQKLYENGFITYMRTDGVYTAPEAIKSAREYVEKKYGEKYLPKKPIIYQNKSKNAQEAHEAIRPTHPENNTISGTAEEQKLYDLIWKRLVASQMESVILDQVGINIKTGNDNNENKTNKIRLFDFTIENYKVGFYSNNTMRHFVRGSKYNKISSDLLSARRVVIDNLEEILSKAKIEKKVQNKSDKHKSVDKWVYLKINGIEINNITYDVIFDTMLFDSDNNLYLYDFNFFQTKKMPEIRYDYRLNASGIIPILTIKNFNVKKNKITQRIINNLIGLGASNDIANANYQLRAVGTTINFDGFYVLYNINKDEEEESEDSEKRLPKVEQGEKLTLKDIKTEQHFTEPPARYNEASIVKKMEELGIGRPSTYANIISVIQEREYVKLDKKRFIPEERGRIVTTFLKKFFEQYVKYDYTAKLETDLDKIANDKKDNIVFLNDFWKPFKEKIDEVMGVKPSEIVENVAKEMQEHLFGVNDKGELNNICPNCGGKLALKFGKFGAFISCSNYPNCKYIKNIGALASIGGDNTDNATQDRFEPKQLGEFKGQNVYLKKGPYGFYIQVGENTPKTTKKNDKDIKKPKLIGVPKTETEPQNFTFEKALLLLNLPDLPRKLGKYEGDEVLANKGRFGPYLQNNKAFYSVKNDDIYTLELNRAIEIIEEGKKKKGVNNSKTVTKPTKKVGGKK